MDLSLIHISTLSFKGEWDWVGLDCFEDGENINQYISVTDSQVWMMPLEWIINSAPKVVTLSIISQLHETNAYLHASHILQSRSLKCQVLWSLWEFRRHYSLPEVPISQQDLADISGIHRSKINPILKQLEKDGLVESGYKYIILKGQKEIGTAFHKEMESN